MSVLGITAFLEHWVKIPKGFFYDHADRGLDTPVIQHETKRNYWIRQDDPALPELINDAEFYADPCGPDECPHIVIAAKALLRALGK